MTRSHLGKNPVGYKKELNIGDFKTFVGWAKFNTQDNTTISNLSKSNNFSGHYISDRD
ncbi:MAG: hypothetical protein Tsb0014_33300 [Pleurocapsa sp.]